MPEAKCKICGQGYCGWALKQPGPHKCDKCGATLEVSKQPVKRYMGPSAGLSIAVGGLVDSRGNRPRQVYRVRLRYGRN